MQPIIGASKQRLKWKSRSPVLCLVETRIHPHCFRCACHYGLRLVNRSGINDGQLVTSCLGYIHGLTWDKVFRAGQGNKKPLGVYTASDEGISTSRDVSTGNTITGIKADGQIEAKAGLREPYRIKATWIFHPDAVKQIRKRKDGDGQYPWSPGIAEGKTILGLPYVASQCAPNMFSTGIYVAIIGDFQYYWIDVALFMQIHVFNEWYAVTNQIGRSGRGEIDGMPVLEKARSRLTLA